MAGISDFSLDPFEQQEQELNDQQKRSLALRLRQAGPPASGDAIGQMMRVRDDMQGQFMDMDIATKRKNLSAQYEDSLKTALVGAPDEIKAMVMSPATRKEGLELLKRHHNMILTQKEMSAYEQPSGGGDMVGPVDPNAPKGGNVPSYATAVKMSLSGDESIKKRGEFLIQHVYQAQDPTHMARGNAVGGFDEIPGARPMAEAVYGIKNPQGYDVPTGQGGMERRGGAAGPAPAAGPSALPMAASASGAPTGPGPAPVASGQPFMPASGGSSLPSSVAASDRAQNMQVAPPTPEQQKYIGMRLQQMGAELKDTMERAEAGDQRAQAAVPQMQAAIRETMKAAGMPADKMAVEAHIQQGRPGLPTEIPPQALPSAVAAAGGPGPGVPQPDAGYGRTNPPRQDIYKHQADTATNAMSKMEENQVIGGKILNSLDKLEKMNQDKTWTGNVGLPMTMDTFASTFSNSKTQRTRNTEAMDAEIQDMLAPMLKAYGYNPSNRDLVAAAKRLPQISQDPQTRQMVIANIKSGIQADLEVSANARQMMDNASRQGIVISPKQAQEQAWAEYNRARDEREAAARQSGNPTQPGNASALPGSRAAAEQSAASPGNDYAGFGEDLVRSAKSLPSSVFSPEGWSAAKDSYGNLLEGTKQLFGQGDRIQSEVDRAAQDERALRDPKYNQAKTLHDWANPSSMIMGESLPGALAGTFMQGALHPAESWNDQIVQGGMSAALTAPFVAGSKAIPSTRLAKSININGEGDALLRQFPSFKPTSSQANPDIMESSVARGAGFNAAAALAQAKAITKDLMTKAGIAGEQLTPKAIQDTETEIGKAYNSILPKNIKARIGSEEKQMFKDAIKEVPSIQEGMAGGSTLAGIHNILLSDNPVNISAQTLHNAWKEVSSSGMDKQAAGKVREVLETLIMKVLPKEEQGAFKALNQQWGLTQDIKRIYSAGGGEGKGSASGFLRPSKIEEEAGRGPTTSATDDAARLINKFKVRDHDVEDIGGPSLGTLARDAIQATIGKVGNMFDASAVRSNPAAKHMIEGLRASVQRTPSTAYQNKDEGQEPIYAP